MQVSTSCPNCSTRFQVSNTVIGKRTRCTKCGKPFVLAEIDPSPVIRQQIQQPREDDAIREPEAESAAESRPSPPPLHKPQQWIDIENGYETPNLADATLPTTEIALGHRKFLALRIVAGIFEILAVLMLLAMTVSITVDALEYNEIVQKGFDELNELRKGRILRDIFNVVIGGSVVILCLLFLANLIRLGIQIERNTYQSQELLQQLHALSLPSGRTRNSESEC